MINYSIIFDKINDDKNIFYYRLSSSTDKSVILSVYNSFLNYKEYFAILELKPNINYWTYVPSNNNNRFVEFRDSETYEVVGLFGLDGKDNLESSNSGHYVKSIFERSTSGVKNNLYSVLNEITCNKIYHNSFVNVEQGDLVIDIGFNYGLFSLESLKFNPRQIIAFEPNPTLVNTFFNYFPISQIEVIRKAVSKSDGKVEFFENVVPGMSSLYQEINNIESDKSYEVDSLNLLNFLKIRNIEQVDYLKIDCEGSEYDIIESLEDYLLSIKKIALEFHHQVDNEKVQKLISTFKEFNFEIKIDYQVDSTVGKNPNIGMLYGRR